MEIILTIVIVLAFALMTKHHTAQRRKKAHEKILKEMGALSWMGRKEALDKLEEILEHVNRHEARRIANHYLTRWCAELMSRSSRSPQEAMAAKENFKTEIREVKRTCKVFGLKLETISAFSEEEMLTAYLRCRVGILEEALQHYPGKAWINISPGDLLATLIDYADYVYVQRCIEKWRGWIRAAYLRQAKREVLRLRDRRHWYPDDADAAVDKTLTLLENAQAEPEEIETTFTELESLRQVAQYGT